MNNPGYLYVGLPGLDGLQYVEGENWLGVALSALMRIPPDRVAWLGAEALRRLTDAPLSEQKKVAHVASMVVGHSKWSKNGQKVAILTRIPPIRTHEPRNSSWLIALKRIFRWMNSSSGSMRNYC